MTLDDEQRAILRHLVDGYSAEQTARRLGCSSRTVRRRLAALVEATGCRSNTQLAVWAAVHRVVPVDVPPYMLTADDEIATIRNATATIKNVREQLAALRKATA